VVAHRRRGALCRASLGEDACLDYNLRLAARILDYPRD
jgi:hypothetical protein